MSGTDCVLNKVFFGGSVKLRYIALKFNENGERTRPESLELELSKSNGDANAKEIARNVLAELLKIRGIKIEEIEKIKDHICKKENNKITLNYDGLKVPDVLPRELFDKLSKSIMTEMIEAGKVSIKINSIEISKIEIKAAILVALLVACYFALLSCGKEDVSLAEAIIGNIRALAYALNEDAYVPFCPSTRDINSLLLWALCLLTRSDT